MVSSRVADTVLSATDMKTSAESQVALSGCINTKFIALLDIFAARAIHPQRTVFSNSIHQPIHTLDRTVVHLYKTKVIGFLAEVSMRSIQHLTPC